MKQGQATPKKNTKKPAPDEKWQIGPYNRRQQFRFILPYQFLILCKIVDVTPERMISDFMNVLSTYPKIIHGQNTKQDIWVEYFIEQGYGQQHYVEQDIRQIFKEMEAIGLVWPERGGNKLVNLSAKWRNKYYKYWFKKWFRKPRRKI